MVAIGDEISMDASLGGSYPITSIQVPFLCVCVVCVCVVCVCVVCVCSVCVHACVCVVCVCLYLCLYVCVCVLLALHIGDEMCPFTAVWECSGSFAVHTTVGPALCVAFLYAKVCHTGVS